jgi:small-conductance mechanosensitive channel
VGDRVLIGDGKGDSMYVQRMELLTTTFRVWDGRINTIPNHVLHNSQIFNITRSGNQTDSLEMFIDFHTPASIIDKLKERYLQFLKDNPNDFIVEQSAFCVRLACVCLSALRL